MGQHRYYGRLDPKALVKLAAEVVPHVDKAALQSALRSEVAADSIYAAAQKLARRLRVRGVPFFIINGEPMFSGAQEPETFLKAFAEAAELETASSA